MHAEKDKNAVIDRIIEDSKAHGVLERPKTQAIIEGRAVLDATRDLRESLQAEWILLADIAPQRRRPKARTPATASVAPMPTSCTRRRTSACSKTYPNGGPTTLTWSACAMRAGGKTRAPPCASPPTPGNRFLM